jgi:hypothetical protein
VLLDAALVACAAAGFLAAAAAALAAFVVNRLAARTAPSSSAVLLLQPVPPVALRLGCRLGSTTVQVVLDAVVEVAVAEPVLYYLKFQLLCM